MLLFTPGPTPVPQSVRDAMSQETLHHRTPEFEAIFKHSRELLFELFDMDEVVMLASTGTGAMEAAVTNLCHKKLLNINSGKFGERFGKIAKAFGIANTEIQNPWDTPASVDEVVQAVTNDSDIDAVAIQVCESAGGLRHYAEEIALAVKNINKDITIIADGITAVGVEKINTANIDCLIAGSQKAFTLPPGLSILGLSSAAVDKITDGRGYYFNLASEVNKQRKNTTAYTAATTLIIGLESILMRIKSEGGLTKVYRNTALRAAANTKALEAIGLHIYPIRAAKAMTTIYDKDAEDIRKILKEDFDINIAGGQDHLKGKIFRINQMGLIQAHEAAWVVNCIELALDKLGRREYNATASRIFNTEFFELNKVEQ